MFQPFMTAKLQNQPGNIGNPSNLIFAANPTANSVRYLFRRLASASPGARQKFKTALKSQPLLFF